MENTNQENLDAATINDLGLRLSQKKINAPLAPEARVFELPGLDDVFVMESDLYGNPMPKGTCFLAFNGRNGMMGQQFTVEELRKASPDELRKIISRNAGG